MTPFSSLEDQKTTKSASRLGSSTVTMGIVEVVVVPAKIRRTGQITRALFAIEIDA